MAILGGNIINGHLIENALVAAFETWVEEDINQRHWEEQFKNMSKWPYDMGDNPTVRKNGQTVDSPRDIYDLGLLYKSGLKTVFEDTGTMVTANWHWDAKNTKGKEYAWYVHEGIGSNTTARPFTDDIAFAPTFFLKAPGIRFKMRVREALARL